MGRCVYRTRTKGSQSCELQVEEINKLDTTLAMKIIYFRLNWVGVVGEREGIKEDGDLGNSYGSRLGKDTRDRAGQRTRLKNF